MIQYSMPRSFMKLILSAAVAATLAASPVQARDATDRDDTAAIIAALLGLVTLGVLLSGNDDEPSTPYGHVSRPYKPTYPDRPHRPHRVSKYRSLPASCLREYRTQTGRKIMFSSNCLNKNFKYASGLPPHLQAQPGREEPQGHLRDAPGVPARMPQRTRLSRHTSLLSISSSGVAVPFTLRAAKLGRGFGLCPFYLRGRAV